MAASAYLLLTRRAAGAVDLAGSENAVKAGSEERMKARVLTWAIA